MTEAAMLEMQKEQAATFLIQWRRLIRTVVKLHNTAYTELKARQREVRAAEGRGFKIIHRETSEDRELKNHIKLCREALHGCGEAVFSLLAIYEGSGATLHDLCQLTNANYKQVVALSEKYLAKNDEPMDFLSLVFAADIELRDSKVEIVYLDTCDAPFRHAITEYVLHTMKHNPEARRATVEVFNELFPTLANNSFIIDPKGRMQQIRKKPNLKIVH